MQMHQTYAVWSLSISISVEIDQFAQNTRIENRVIIMSSDIVLFLKKVLLF